MIKTYSVAVPSSPGAGAWTDLQDAKPENRTIICTNTNTSQVQLEVSNDQSSVLSPSSLLFVASKEVTVSASWRYVRARRVTGTTGTQSCIIAAEQITADGLTHIKAMKYTNPAAASTAGLKAATATVTSPVTLTDADLIAGGVAELDANPRQLVFTTAGGTPADAPATATISGNGPGQVSQTEVVNLAQTAAGVTSTKTWHASGLRIDYAEGQGTDATVAIGWAAGLGLRALPKVYDGKVAVVNEIADGARVVNGAFTTPATNGPYGLYTPNSAADGSRDYLVHVEVED